ncbi:MAG: hypothetical protein R3A47_01530 [Polyangiales bacterium]
MIRHFLSLDDLSSDELIAILDRAEVLKASRMDPTHPKPLQGKSVAIIFDKASTRTRISFEVGVQELGGIAVPLISKDTQLAAANRSDTAKMLSRYVHIAVYRTFGHDRLEELAKTRIDTDREQPLRHVSSVPTSRRHDDDPRARRSRFTQCSCLLDRRWQQHGAFMDSGRRQSGVSPHARLPKQYSPNAALLKRATTDLGA